MSQILKTEWTITPTTTPQPWIACSTCGENRPFRCSDRLRLNANGRKLDAWLIYRCSICDRTWNRTLFERRNVREIHPDVLAALHANDAGWIRGLAFDVNALRRHAERIDQFTEVEVEKSGRHQALEWSRLEISFRITLPVSLRLDRLLCTELGLSRSRLQTLDGAGKLVVDPQRKAALRRAPADGTRVSLDLSDEPDRPAVEVRACGA